MALLPRFHFCEEKCGTKLKGEDRPPYRSELGILHLKDPGGVL